jgi:carbamate kinase
VNDGSGRMRGVEAVVEKDLTVALLAWAIDADALLLLTDVDAVADGYGTPQARSRQRTAGRHRRHNRRADSMRGRR